MKKKIKKKAPKTIFSCGVSGLSELGERARRSKVLNGEIDIAGNLSYAGLEEYEERLETELIKSKDFIETAQLNKHLYSIKHEEYCDFADSLADIFLKEEEDKEFLRHGVIGYSEEEDAGRWCVLSKEKVEQLLLGDLLKPNGRVAHGFGNYARPQRTMIGSFLLENESLFKIVNVKNGEISIRDNDTNESDKFLLAKPMHCWGLNADHSRIMFLLDERFYPIGRALRSKKHSSFYTNALITKKIACQSLILKIAFKEAVKKNNIKLSNHDQAWTVRVLYNLLQYAKNATYIKGVNQTHIRDGKKHLNINLETFMNLGLAPFLKNRRVEIKLDSKKINKHWDLLSEGVLDVLDRLDLDKDELRKKKISLPSDFQIDIEENKFLKATICENL